MNLARRNLLCILLACTVCLPVDAGEARYFFRVYTPEEGLANGTLRGIAPGSTGFIWAFSRNGLSRFDGHRFKVFIPDRNNPQSICSYSTHYLLLDGFGNRLFRTDNSICKFVGDSLVFRNLYTFLSDDDVLACTYSRTGAWIIERASMLHLDSKKETGHRIRYPSGFEMNSGSLSMEIGNDLWLGSENGIYRFEPRQGSFHLVPSRNPENKAGPASDPPLLFFKNEQGRICYFSRQGSFCLDATRDEFVRMAGLPLELNPARVRKIFQHSDGRIVLSMRQDSVFFFHPVRGALQGFLLEEGAETFDAISSEDGSIWVSTSNSGVFRIYPGSGRMEHLFRDAGNRLSLESNNIEYLLEHKRVLWMTTPGLGLIKAELDMPLIDHYVPERAGGASNRIRSLAEYDRNSLLIGTMSGLFFFNKRSGAFRNVPSPENGIPLLKDTAVTAIARDHAGNYWIAGLECEYLTVLCPRQHKVVRVYPTKRGEASRTMRSLFVDSGNRLWVGTEDNCMHLLDLNGFNPDTPLRITSEQIEGRVSDKDTLLFNSVFVIYECRDHRILIGTQDGFYVTRSGKEFTRYTNSTNDHRTVSNQSIRAFLEDSKGNLWIGTAGGGLNKANKNFSHFEVYNADLGRLSDNFVFSILEDSAGLLWMGTNSGICRFDPNIGYYRRFSTRDGVQNNEFTTQAALHTAEGEIAMGGINGLNIFRPAAIQLKTDTPTVIISEFKVNDKNHPISPQVRLEHDENDISIEFAALNYFRSRENQYAYKLEGYQNDWVYLRNRRFVNFINLPPGEYTFRAKGCDFNGVWNEDGASMVLYIAKPYWQTTGFKVLLIVLVLGAVFYLFRTRLVHRLRLEQFRNRLSRDLHDEIGSNLSGVALFCKVAGEKIATDPAVAALLIQKIRDFNQSSQDAINDIVWMVNAENDSFEKVEARMRKSAIELFEPMGIDVNFLFDENRLPARMPMNQRRNFYLIFKEAINNIAKHANARTVWITLKGEGNQIRLVIQDDGKGFESREDIAGNGLLNMQKRAELLGGRLSVNSHLGKGTTIELNFTK